MQTDVLTAPEPRAGGAERRLPLAWAQAHMWGAVWGYEHEARHLVIPMRIDLAPGTPEQHVRRAVAGVVAGHDILRTTFPFDERVQVQVPHVEVPVVVVDADGDPAAATDALVAALCRTPFDHEVSPPLRVGLVRSGSGVSTLVLGLSHLAFDLSGALLLRDRVAQVLGGAEPPAGPPAVQTADLVDLERSPDGVAASTAVIERWDAAMRRLAPGGGVGVSRSGVFPIVGLRSTALAIAAQVVAVQQRVSTSSVVLAATVRAFAEVAPYAPSAWKLVVGNRHSTPVADYAGIALQDGLLSPPAMDSSLSLAEQVRAVHTRALWSYANARYDSDRLRELVLDLMARGAAPDLSYLFNDVRWEPRGWAGLEARLSELVAGTHADEAPPAVLGEWTRWDCTAFVTLGTNGAEADVRLQVDEGVVDRTTAAAVLVRVRDLVVASAVGKGVRDH